MRFPTEIQAMIYDPAKCLGSKPANTIFKVGAGGDVDITKWFGVEFTPVSDCNLEFNGVATSIKPLLAGVEKLIIIHPGTTQIKLLTSAAVICGM